MKRYFITVLFLVSFNAYSNSNTYPLNLEGTYDCHSTNSGGKMKIKKTDQTYSIESFHDDGSHYLGTGIYNQTTHTFAVAFRNVENPLMVSFGIADVNENGSMTTSWAFLYDTVVKSSFCIKAN